MLGHHRMRIALLSMLVACAYRAGSFSSWQADFSGRRMTNGCVDLSIERRADQAGGPVLGYVVGNRCDHAIVIDLQHAAVIAKVPGGAIDAAPYDPDGEIRPLPLDGRSVAGEAIEYRVESPGAAIRAICVDTSSIVETASPLPDWQCFPAGAAP